MLFTLLYILFFSLLYLPLHSYIVYPITIHFLAMFKQGRKVNSGYEPDVTIIISAFNEEKVIENRIRNILALDYPQSKIQILIGSDCSSDKTDEIVSTLAANIPNLEFYSFKVRRGKAAVINELFGYCKNDILVFTDANTEFDKDAIRLLVKHYEDKKLGGVSGRLILKDPENIEKSNAEGTYWKYETFIKVAEGKYGILIGANGGIFSLRKEFFKPLPLDKPITDDFYLTLNVLAQKKKFIYEYDAIAIEEVAQKTSQEFNRKVRFSATNFQTMFFFKNLLFNPNMLLSYAFWSHKIIRWFIPVILIMLFVVNLILANQNIYLAMFFYLQVTFITLALLGYLFSKLKFNFFLFSLPYFFLLSNYAVLLGLIKYLRNKHTIIWQSTPR